MFKRWRKLKTDSLEKMNRTLDLSIKHGIQAYAIKTVRFLEADFYLSACCYRIPVDHIIIFCKCTKEQWQFLNEVGLGNFFTYKY